LVLAVLSGTVGYILIKETACLSYECIGFPLLVEPLSKITVKNCVCMVEPIIVFIY
jgi:hypothetical protein